MTGWATVGKALAATFAFSLVLSPVAPLAGQQSGPFKVLIPAFFPEADVSDKFGDRIADELRKLIHELPSHDAVEEKDIEKQAKGVAQMEMKEMDCVTVSQLSIHLSVPVYVCGTYRAAGEKMVEVDVTFGAVGAGTTGGEFKVATFTVADNAQKEAAAQLLSAFNSYNQQQVSAAACDRYFSSRAWDDAIRACGRTLEMNPGAIGAMFVLGAVYIELEEYGEALGYFDQVIALDPVYNEALNTAGYAAAMAGESAKAHEYYSQYLMFQPANVAVRLSIAYELAVEGQDPQGGMKLIAEGIAIEPDNVELLKTYASYAFYAGRQIAEADGTWDEGELSEESRTLLREALEGYAKVMGMDADAVDPATMLNLTIARVKMADYEGALEQTEEALRRNPQAFRFIDLRAGIFTRQGRHAEALTELDQVRRIAPDSVPGLQRRRGQRLMALNRAPEAVDAFREAIAAGQVDPGVVASMLLADGFERGINQKDYDYGVEMFSLAEALDIDEATEKRILFFKGYALYLKGVELQKPDTPAAAQAAMPFLRQARTALLAAGDHAEEGGSSAAAVADNAQQYIERGEYIIKNGGDLS